MAFCKHPVSPDVPSMASAQSKGVIPICCRELHRCMQVSLSTSTRRLDAFFLCRKTDNLYTKRKAEGVLKDRVELPQCAAMRSLGTVVPIQADSTEACEKLNGCATEDCNFDKKNRTRQCSFTKCYHAVPQKPCTLYSRVKSCATSIKEKSPVHDTKDRWNHAVIVDRAT
jgi:hypothetical protein